MFIYNFKVNGGIILRIIIIVLSLFMLGVFLFSIYRIFFTSGKFKVEDTLEAKEITEIEPENYTNVLQAVHDNPDSYLGMKIKENIDSNYLFLQGIQWTLSSCEIQYYDWIQLI